MVYKKKKPVEGRKWYRYHFFGKAEITVSGDKTIVDASVANISFAGIGIYSPVPIDKGKKVKIIWNKIEGQKVIQDIEILKEQ